MVLKVINAEDYVRNNPEVFFGSSKNICNELSLKIASDAFYLGAFPVLIDKIGENYIVSSDKNWLEIDDEIDSMSFFSVLKPFPEKGINACRHELVLKIYSHNLAIIDDGLFSAIKGSFKEEEIKAITNAIQKKFLIIFNRI